MTEKKDTEQQDLKQTGPLEFADLVARIVKDSTLLILVGVALFWLLAVNGYSTQDPGWSHAGYQPEISNFTGRAGALWADLAFSFFGLSAWFIPLLVIMPCVRLYLRRETSLLDSLPFVMLRTVGALLLVFTCCALASLHISNAEFDYPFTAGGLIGQAFADWMVSWFSLLGSSVVLWFCLLLAFTWYSETSWRDLIALLGGALLSVVSYLRNTFASNKEADEYGHIQNDDVLEEEATSILDESFSAEKDTHQGMSEAQEPSVKDKLKGLFIRETPPSVVAEDTAEVSIPPVVNKADRKLATNIQSALAPNSPVDPDVKPVVAAVVTSATSVTSQKNVAEKEKPTPVPVSNTAVSEQKVHPAIIEPAVLKTAPPKVSSSPAEPAQSTKRELKIVPLSETHQSTLQPDADTSSAKAAAPSNLATLPPVSLLDPAEPVKEQGYSAEQLEDMSRLLEFKLKDFGVVVEVVEVNPGPVITRFEIQPAPGVKSSKIVNLAKDLARSLAVMSVRVVEVIPGKSVMGIEIPNISRQMVRLSEVLEAPVYQDAASYLTLALGNDIAGNPVVANLAKMPHLLVAGTTGSGKSVGVNAMILSLLFKATPQEVRLMLVDPKMLELSIYEGIPHLLTPVITDMKEAAGGLRWCVAEMERRYKLMSKMGVRNLDGFNQKVRDGIANGDPYRDPVWDAQEQGQPPGSLAPLLETLPFIVVVIDEFADMMMIVGKKVEELIARIAQKARAAGIHLILATQRPSVDVITGLIKANVPTRIGFQVSSKIDSRTILDQGGAENLLGNGDMLYLPAGTSVPSRVHGAFVSDDEVHRTVEAWKSQGRPKFIDLSVSEEGEAGAGGTLFEDDEQDVLYDEAVAFVTTTRKASISSVQRKLKIGYNRAARMIESMEAAGVITQAGSNGQREVLAPPPPPRDY